MATITILGKDSGWHDRLIKCSRCSHLCRRFEHWCCECWGLKDVSTPGTWMDCIVCTIRKEWFTV